MKKTVYITDFSLRLGNLTKTAELISLLKGALSLPEPKNEIFKGKKVQYHNLICDPESPYYPKASDIKVMRDDVIASVQCVTELLERQHIHLEQRTHIPLYVSNGIFIENIVERFGFLNSSLMEAINSADPKERNEKVYRLVPPLLALLTLTNSTESFVAQYTGIAGNNGTYGNTSQSGHYAFREACAQIEEGHAEIVLAGGSNCTGDYSYLSHKSFITEEEFWKEGACSAFLLLESEEHVRKRKITPLATVSSCVELNKVTSLFEPSNSAPYILGKQLSSGTGISFSGAYSESEFTHEKNHIQQITDSHFSWFHKSGNLGAASIFMNLIAALIHPDWASKKNLASLNRDVYGRESLIELER